MGADVGGGSVGVVVGSDVDVLVGGGVAVVVRIGDEPSDGDRQAVRKTMSNIKMMAFFGMMPFPFSSQRARSSQSLCFPLRSSFLRGSTAFNARCSRSCL